MRSTQQFSITLPTAMAADIKEKVASGAYASDSEVVRDGLRALQARDRVVEAWLRDQVVPIHDAMAADPSAGLSGGEIRALLAREDELADAV